MFVWCWYRKTQETSFPALPWLPGVQVLSLGASAWTQTSFLTMRLKKKINNMNDMWNYQSEIFKKNQIQ